MPMAFDKRTCRVYAHGAISESGFGITTAPEWSFQVLRVFWK